MMKSEAILVNGIRSTRDDACLGRLIEFSGLHCRTINASMFTAELNRAADHELCVLASATTIDEWCDKCQDPAHAMDKLRQKVCSLFVYGFAPQTPMYIAAGLSDGAISDVRRFTGADLRYHVRSSHPEITSEFSGLSFGPVRSATDFGFVCPGNSSSIVPLITIKGMPLWLLIQKNGCKAFLLACSAIADIDEEISNFDSIEYFSRLLPAAMFLKSSFKRRCWHSKYRFANFIIDDPPLKPSYGFLNYRDLISTMETAGFASTIAFIPWNYRRIHSDVAQLFREYPERLSLCVHGCDHTKAEFATRNLAVLNSKVQLASARMNSLRRQNGLSYSQAMVFPQGRFSAEALTALKSNNYLAALNSSASPVNSAANRSMTIAASLEPAVTRHGGFPLFVRRYPGPLERFAFDLFFGKPALVVEHHKYLKDRGAGLAKFVSQLNSLAGLRWSGLHEIMTKSCLECEISNEITACKIYTNQQVIENHSQDERTFLVIKCELNDVPVQRVLVSGRPIAFRLWGDLLQFAILIPAFSSKEVKIEYRNALPSEEPRRAFTRRSRVWARRMLTEFRDNVLCRSNLLLAGAQALKRR